MFFSLTVLKVCKFKRCSPASQQKYCEATKEWKPQDLTSTHEHLKTPQPHFISITENWKKKLSYIFWFVDTPFSLTTKNQLCITNFA